MGAGASTVGAGAKAARALRLGLRRLLIGLVRLWQWGPSAMMGPTCRFSPSCSAYAITAIERHGAIKGGWLALKRLLRCHPWGGFGHDPVP